MFHAFLDLPVCKLCWFITCCISLSSRAPNTSTLHPNFPEPKCESTLKTRVDPKRWGYQNCPWKKHSVPQIFIVTVCVSLYPLTQLCLKHVIRIRIRTTRKSKWHKTIYKPACLAIWGRASCYNIPKKTPCWCKVGPKNCLDNTCWWTKSCTSWWID